nr:integrator complex subunit 3 homolog [Meriones unguiculatus]
MQIRYSFSSMVLPAPDPGRGGDVPADERGWRPAEGEGAASRRAGEAVSALRSAPPGCLRSAPEHVRLRVPASATPPPPCSQRSALPVVQSQGLREGRPAEDGSAQQPRASRRGHQIRTCPAAGEREARGWETDLREFKQMHKSNPPDPPPKAEPNLASPPFPPTRLPWLMSPGTQCRGSRRC